MENQNPMAEYPATQAALWQRSLNMFSTIDRDAAVLGKHGISAAAIAKFKADTATFGELEPDTVVQQEGVVVTEAKSQARLDLETAMQTVLDCIGLKDDPRTARYKRFGVAAVTSLLDAKLHLGATMLYKQGTKYAAEYTEKGLAPALLAAVQTADAAFVDSLVDRHEAVSTRAGATRARVLFANKLYRQLVALANAGQAAWHLTDAQKAGEYIIDPATAGAKPGVAPL